MCGLVVHQTDPFTSWGVGVLRYHRIPPLRPTSTDHSVLWVCRTVVRRVRAWTVILCPLYDDLTDHDVRVVVVTYPHVLGGCWCL
jgi:hypothetical protein